MDPSVIALRRDFRVGLYQKKRRSLGLRYFYEPLVYK